MKVHFIAIGGSAMHNLAIALKNKGFEVTGSDDAIFEPSKTRLEQKGILPKEFGWFPEKITADIDAVILGMHAHADNPELVRAKELGLKIYSYPEFLYQQSKEKTRVVIAGSHGKTTITSMILHVLNFHNKEIDYMVGAQLEGFDYMVKITEDTDFMILEGDEYLSSADDRQPKFLHYHPNIALISGIAWDHINVFKTFDVYLEQFRKFTESITSGGVLVYNEEDEEVVKIVENSQKYFRKLPYKTPEYSIREGKVYLKTSMGEIPLSVFGKHNLLNIEGAKLICQQLGNALMRESICGNTVDGIGGHHNRVVCLQRLAGSLDGLAGLSFSRYGVQLCSHGSYSLMFFLVRRDTGTHNAPCGSNLPGVRHISLALSWLPRGDALPSCSPVRARWCIY